ncbi:MAG: helix-turn-helix domain-containing protein [Microbacterium ginsengisoli]|jgi:AraC family transcriptional regulator, transcriptional activator FtrA|uniref:GlxA family transcriptional regulator n=1 Tax=Microbacterium TaxID=33882 RepID=UPI0006F63768|nr:MULTISPECIES: helix-turn-helix domain-containing protein [unclassified Microbacterium]MBN9199115.1 helix-turn-helix domain-containing protein [Microbacterium ginsengisoli]KQR99232.1 AraC family transcriptional regulator [Microbacterium sp. Leaf347]KQS02543.1 AraC family transcriptional regulator [Microbacterium sp. Leaf351]ODU77064.1 MAG: AraC family transcriptional regulator [Microbacterium sp. SCN 71-21]OJU74962.1 MAG: AraC family transcriptional regulator [Microbacterium sp. 71-23]
MRTVAVIVQPGFAPFEFGLACEAFGLDRSDDGIEPFEFRICAPDPGAIPSNLGFSINVVDDLTFAETADLVVVTPVPRASWSRIDPRVTAVVQAAAARRAWLLSVCSGAFVLAAAGVLDGRRATTHWKYATEMTRLYPAVDLDPDVLYVQDDTIITSAGTAAGLDACLHLLRIELGAEVTNTIARRMVVPPQRDGGQAQFISQPLPAVASLSLAPVTDWMLANLHLDLTVDQLAARAHMSTRTFARRFKQDLGATPAAWLARQRVLHAQRLLERTDHGIDRIADESGFGSAAVLRQNFVRTLGLSPSAYRSRFSCPDERADAAASAA